MPVFLSDLEHQMGSHVSCFECIHNVCGERLLRGKCVRHACRGYNLPAKYVIHTVGPRYRGAKESAPLLTSAYK
jgi:O-acetyl-ADP-ribose deacetylase (regulator of RNase III)